MATISFQGVTREYTPGERPAVSDFNLDIDDGEFLVLVGPSGCGKSTTLRMLAGLEPINKGKLLIDGKDATQLRPQDRDVAMVFQSYALYPNMTVRENMSFALKNQKVPKEKIEEKVAEATRILQLEDYLDRKPSALSGGQRQRVAMGRAIVRDADIFCMDEPLSNLDAKLRVSTRAEISALQRRLGVTTVYVTHDQVEAMTMGDRVAVLLAGVLQQVDAPQVLYDKPANVFVASFIGSPSMNLLEATLRDASVQIGTGTVIHLSEQTTAAIRAHGTAPGDDVIVGARPEHMEIVEPTARGAVEAEVHHIDELGAESMIYVRAQKVKNPDSSVLGHGVSDDMRVQITPADENDAAEIGIRVDRNHGVNLGDIIHVAAPPETLHVFHGGHGARLND